MPSRRRAIAAPAPLAVVVAPFAIVTLAVLATDFALALALAVDVEHEVLRDVDDFVGEMEVEVDADDVRDVVDVRVESFVVVALSSCRA